jgi:hypothetical protein
MMLWYYSDLFFELSSEMSSMWSCDCVLLLYIIISINWQDIIDIYNIIYHFDQFFKKFRNVIDIVM